MKMEKYLLSLILLLPINYVSAGEKVIKAYSKEEMKKIRKATSKSEKTLFIGKACQWKVDELSETRKNLRVINIEIKNLEKELEHLKEKRTLKIKEESIVRKEINQCVDYQSNKFKEKTNALRLLNQ